MVRDLTGAILGAYVVGFAFCVLGVLLAAGLLRWAGGRRKTVVDAVAI